MQKKTSKKQRKNINLPIIKAAKNIKLLVLDVDGVLTNGDLWFTDKGEEIKVFNVQDGYGIKSLLRHGIEVAIISGRKTEAVNKRMVELGVKYVYQNIGDKLPILDLLINTLKVSYMEVAYVGDDIPDLLALQKVGLGVAVKNATHKIQQHAKLVTQACGGKGAVREVCELLLGAQNGTF